MTMKFAAFLIASLSLAQGPVSNPKANKQMKAWVDPVTEDLPPTHYKLFHSALIHGDYSYLVYLPPDYETAPQRRYPPFTGCMAAEGISAGELLSSSCWMPRSGKAPR